MCKVNCSERDLVVMNVLFACRAPVSGRDLRFALDGRSTDRHCRMPLSVAGFYSMMAQMESAGLLVGAWDHEFIGATRVKCRVYSLTDEGHRYVEAMLEGRLCFSTPKPPKRKSWLDRLVDWFALEDPDRD